MQYQSKPFYSENLSPMKSQTYYTLQNQNQHNWYNQIPWNLHKLICLFLLIVQTIEKDLISMRLKTSKLKVSSNNGDRSPVEGQTRTRYYRIPDADWRFWVTSKRNTADPRILFDEPDEPGYFGVGEKTKIYFSKISTHPFHTIFFLGKYTTIQYVICVYKIWFLSEKDSAVRYWVSENLALILLY